MARLNINIGTTANDKTGDPLRTAFDKVNQNFVELYAHVGADVQIPSQTNNGGKYLTTNGTTLSWSESFSGDYNDLANLPTLFSGDYNDLTNLPTLFSGDYNDLTNAPTINSTGDITFSGRTIGASTVGSITVERDFEIAGNDFTITPTSGDNTHSPTRIFLKNPSSSDVLTIQSVNDAVDQTINRAWIWARPGANSASIRDILVGTDGGSVILRSTGDNASTHDWTFNRTGDLSVPGNITKTSGNLEITAENYVVIDSTNGGQIDIGANQSGEGSGDSGPILMGHAGNTLDIQSGKIRVNSAVPTHSTGALNDVVGLVAFDGSYIYYCTADYVSAGGGGATVELVPNQLGQNTNSLTIQKNGLANGSWATLQVNWTLTVNSTTVTVEELTDDADNLYIVVSGPIQLPMTGSITFTEPGGAQPNIWKRVAWSGDTW